MANRGELTDEFSKYTDRGAYHWQHVAGSFLRRNAREDAKYSMVVREVKKRLPRGAVLGLEAGAGDGVLTWKFVRARVPVVGVDYTPEALRLAVEELSKRKVRAPVALGDVGRLPFADDSFDFVTAVELIEHLPDVPGFLSEVSRVVRPGGCFVCTTPNRGDRPYGTIQDPFHVREYTAPELDQMLSCHLERVRISGRIPAWLDRLYLRDRKTRLADKLIRVAFRCIAFGLANPYSIASSSLAGPEWALLLGVGYVR